MKIEKLEYNGDVYYYVNEYNYRYGTFHKFANINEEIKKKKQHKQKDKVKKIKHTIHT